MAGAVHADRSESMSCPSPVATSGKVLLLRCALVRDVSLLSLELYVQISLFEDWHLYMFLADVGVVP